MSNIATKEQALEQTAEWSDTTLGELAGFEMGQAPPGNECNKEGKGTVFVKAGEFADSYPVEVEWTTKPLKFGRKGDVFICVVGATAGKLNLGIDCAIGRSVAAIRPHEGVDTKFLYYQLMPWVLKLRAASAGSAQGVISKAQLKEIPFKVVGIDQQKLIVAEIEKQFSRLDEAVASLKRVKANLKRYKAAVLKAAVEGRLVETEAELSRREGRSYETGEQLLQRILETRRSQWKGKSKYKEPAVPDTSDLPELPEGWVSCSGEQFFEWSSGEGLTEKNQRPGPYPVYGGNGISGYHDEYVVEEPTIVIGRVGAHCGNVYVTKPKCWITDNAIYAKSFSRDVPLEYLQIVFIQAGLNRIAAGSGQPFVNQRMLNEVLVQLPPFDEQLRILAEVERRVSLVEEVEAQVDTNLKRAERLRQAILYKAFTGHNHD